MVKKVELHVDAMVGIVVVLVASFGFNLYQRYQYASLLTEHAQLQWRLQDTEFNWKLAQGRLDKCAAETGVAPADGK